MRTGDFRKSTPETFAFPRGMSFGSGWPFFCVNEMISAENIAMRCRKARSPVLGALTLSIAMLWLSGCELSAATFWVTNANDSGSGSLRQAITDANATPGLDTINFQIPGTGAHTISPGSALPSITDLVVIDGTTQPGFSGSAPVIELNGSGAGANAGLRLVAGSNTIRGLVINRFGADGIRVDGPGGNSIVGCYVGIDPGGSIARGNTLNGILVNGSSGNMIGGTKTADRNVISGNGDTGVYLLNGSGNIVQGNYIGTSSAGTADLGNTNNGVAVVNSTANVIGGASISARNIISGNNGSGVYLSGSGASMNLVQGNFIGTDFTGTAALSNVADGITLSGGANNTIGGTNAGAGNIISGNGKAGVYLQNTGAGNNLVAGNYIGTDASGKVGIGNVFAGITLSAANSNQVGGNLPAARNIICANKQDGIFMTNNSTGNMVTGNYVGVDATGSNAVPNLFNGISISASGSNIVGGTAGGGNIISGNANYGLQLFAGATGNAVQGNYIGSDVTGSSLVSNRLSGVRIESSGNTIGGASAAARNLISGNGEDGIVVVGAAASGNLVQGNFIGTTSSGLGALRNGRAGIGISGAGGNVIGGTAIGSGNLVSGNGDAGIYLIGAGAVGNIIRGNILGADISGTSGLGNAFEGIYLERASSNTIGGSVFGAGNLISANYTRGIYLYTNSSWNIIQGNFIGTKIDGASALGNGFHAVECEVGANNNSIGAAGGVGNRIAFSPGVYCGVRVRDGSTNNAILGNSIFSNGALGIDLGAAGPAANDSCDSDTGANMLQNYPVLTQVVTGRGIGIRGTLNSKASSTFLLQFFANAACDASGYGEGQIYLGDKTVVTSNNCNVSFVATFTNSIPAGYAITSTATDSANNTSEFSACAPATVAPSLDIIPAGGSKINLCWTNTVSGFVLKQTTSLSPPIQWTTVTNSPVSTNGQFLVQLPVTTTNRFYLLNFE